MRKQPRIAATLAAFLLSSGMVVADMAATAEPAAAATTRSTRSRRARRVRRVRYNAPPTAENFARLRQCESSGNYAINTGNGYYGAYQFDARTWRAMGYSGLPHQASAAVQDEAAARLQSQRGWQPWPGCARRLRLR